MSSQQQIVILGGGVIGLSCALHLRDAIPGARIAIVDRPTNAGIASRAAAGMLAPYAEFAEDSPLAELCRRSYELWPQFLRNFAPTVELARAGTLLPFDTDSDSKRIAARIAVLERQGIAFDVLRGGELRRREPAIARSVSHALWLPEALVHPLRLHAALQEAAQARGIDFADRNVVAIDRSGDRATALRFEGGGGIPCEEVIVATGAWSRATGTIFGIDIPMRPIKGQVLTLAVADAELPRHTIHTEHIYIAPRPGEGAVCGATMEDRGFDTSVDDDVSRELAREASRLVPALRGATIAQAWSGLRPRTDDRTPIIRRAQEWENVIIATGHFRNGILLTPITGKIVLEEVMGKK